MKNTVSVVFDIEAEPIFAPGDDDEISQALGKLSSSQFAYLRKAVEIEDKKRMSRLWSSFARGKGIHGS